MSKMGSIPKTKKKKFPESTSEMSKEMLQETLKKKRECNVKALSIVEKLCENPVEEEWFLQNLEFINQCHLEDAIVERTLLKLCGYPLCNNKLGEVPSKKYHISTRYNKVFDITERKNYCSSICYKASVYIKNQLLTSPLWFRDMEDIPKFVLLKCSSSSMGEEVVMTEDFKLEDRKNTEDSSKTVEEDKNEIVEEIIENLKIAEPDEVKKLENPENSDHNFDTKETEMIKVKRLEPQPVILPTRPESEIVEEVLPVDPVSRVEQCVFEWFNLSSMLFLLGEEKVKELLNDKTEEIKEALTSTTMAPGLSERVDRLINFFSVMDIQLSSDSGIKNLKPLPDYSFIKEEGKNLEVKVKAFFKGQLEIEQVKKEKDEELNESQETENIYLPLVDTHAQNALRRRILLDRLNRIVPELLRTFAPDFTLDMSELRSLVSNFTLEAHNIVFKPTEWYLVGIIIIKLLSLKFKRLKTALETESSKKHLTLLLMSYQLKEDYLDNIVEWLMNGDSIVKKLNKKEHV